MSQTFTTIVDDDGTRYTYLTSESGERVPVEVTVPADRYALLDEDLRRMRTVMDYANELRKALREVLETQDPRLYVMVRRARLEELTRGDEL